MKKNLLLAAAAVMLSLCGYAQTKGTNTFGLGITSYVANLTSEGSGYQNTSKNTSRVFSLGYGHFIKENVRLGLDLSYARNTSDYNYSGNQPGNQESGSKTYGGSLNYQQYYPLIKTLYAYAGGKAGYMSTKVDNDNSNVVHHRSNDYSVGAYGGISWFPFKRFAFETSLLSADVRYTKIETESAYNNFNSEMRKETMFNLSSSGLINGLGFKIYLLF